MKTKIICSAILTSLLGGCAGYYNIPAPRGVLWTDVVAPVNPAYQMESRENVNPTRVGYACSHNVLGLVAWGDNSLGEAIRLADIEKVSSVDVQEKGIPLLGGSICTVVSGD